MRPQVPCPLVPRSQGCVQQGDASEIHVIAVNSPCAEALDGCSLCWYTGANEALNCTDVIFKGADCGDGDLQRRRDLGSEWTNKREGPKAFRRRGKRSSSTLFLQLAKVKGSAGLTSGMSSCLSPSSAPRVPRSDSLQAGHRMQ